MIARALSWLPLLAACATQPPLPPGVEALSLDGRELRAPQLEAAVAHDREAALADARLALERTSADLDAAIWVGRRRAYLGRYRDAIAHYTAALQRWPDAPELLRHRGHRHLTVREFDRAVADLQRAAELVRGQPDRVEPDGLPVPGRPPHSTLQFNIHYHLGLAQFVRGDFAAAARAWSDCLDVAGNHEAQVAVRHWLWSVHMRLGDRDRAAAAVAPVHPDLDVIENRSYLELCLLYRNGTRPVERAGGSSGAALQFGLAHHELVRGDPAAARRAFAALAASPEWAAFGVIAAEAELARR
jgi:tetratricopeptide (TPR) repeat protein